MSLVSASYKSPDYGTKDFTVDESKARYQTTNGKTTGPSEHVLNAGQIDVDRPSDPRKNPDGSLTYLGQLRANLTGLQDDINEFLTERMEVAKGKKKKLEAKDDVAEEQRIKKEINELLDGGEDEEESGE